MVMLEFSLLEPRAKPFCHHWQPASCLCFSSQAGKAPKLLVKVWVQEMNNEILSSYGRTLKVIGVLLKSSITAGCP